MAAGVLLAAHELQVGDVLGVASDLFEIETRSGRHHLDGFFLLAGAGIEEGKQLALVIES